MLMLALPGGAYVYQGEELGLPEVEDLPVTSLQDPRAQQSGGTDPGRDGCRVPIPWSGDAPSYGFRVDGGSTTWLPQPSDWGPYTVERELGDPDSMVNLYRRALAIRRTNPALGDGSLVWNESPPGSLSFTRDPGLVCVVNFEDAPVRLPPHGGVILASSPIGADHRLPNDAAVWLRIGD
jgi:alpha-glucosidase